MKSWIHRSYDKGWYSNIYEWRIYIDKQQNGGPTISFASVKGEIELWQM